MPTLASTSIGHDAVSFLDAAGGFFSDLTSLHWGALLLGLAFFTANLSLKEALKGLIRQENKPLSDQKLAEMLTAQGWQVARRTVAKYREELKILSSSER